MEMKVSFRLAANQMVEDSVDDQKVVKTMVQDITDQDKPTEVNAVTASYFVDAELQLTRKSI